MHKTIVIDLYNSYERNVGLGEFSYKIAEGLAQRAPKLLKNHNIKLYFVVHKSMKGAFGNHINYIVLNSYNRILLRFLPLKADILHLPHQFCRMKELYTSRFKLLTVHDINFMYEKKGAKLDKYKAIFDKRLRRADALSFISNFSQHDVVSNFEVSKMHQRVIYNGTTDLTKDSAADISQLGLPTDFLFHVSSLQPKKNIHLLVDMMKYLPDENLVIAGDWGSPYAKALQKRIQDENISNIYTLHNISYEVKVALFEKCKAFLFPSQCEGFGLPPIEAMYFGKPVFVSTLTSLPEVCGEEGYYWDNLDPVVMAEVVKTKLVEFEEDKQRISKKLRERAKYFDWDKCIDEYIAYYVDILAR